MNKEDNLNKKKRPLIFFTNNNKKIVDIIYMDGPVACGKSTKLNTFKKNSVIIEEPIELWDLDKEENIITNSIDNFELELTIKYDYIVNMIVKIISNINKGYEFDKIIIERSIFDHEFFNSFAYGNNNIFDKHMNEIFNWIHSELFIFLNINDIIIYQPYDIISKLDTISFEKMLLKNHDNKEIRGRKFELNYNIKYFVIFNRFYDLRYLKKYFEAINSIKNFNIILKDETYYLI